MRIVWYNQRIQGRQQMTMQTLEQTERRLTLTCGGSRKVIAFRNDQQSRWTATLYVNRGDTITNIRGTFQTERGLRKWAEKQLSA